MPLSKSNSINHGGSFSADEQGVEVEISPRPRHVEEGQDVLSMDDADDEPTDAHNSLMTPSNETGKRRHGIAVKALKVFLVTAAVGTIWGVTKKSKQSTGNTVALKVHGKSSKAPKGGKSAQPSSQPSSEPSSQPSSQPSYSGFPLDGSLTLTPADFGGIVLYSPDGLYQMGLSAGNLILRYCPSGFDLSASVPCSPPGSNCITPNEPPSVQWSANTFGGSFAALKNDGNLVVYDDSSPPVDQWSSDTCAGCSLNPAGQGTRLYLPGPTSACQCKAYMCIVVDTGGGVDYYYAVTWGEVFTKTLTFCPYV